MEIKTILPPVGDRHSGKSLPRLCLLSVGLGTRLSGTALACRRPRVRPEHARINTATSNSKTRGRCREDVEKRKPRSLFGPPHHDFLDTPKARSIQAKRLTVQVPTKAPQVLLPQNAWGQCPGTASTWRPL